jgi:hypothetical protein
MHIYSYIFTCAYIIVLYKLETHILHFVLDTLFLLLETTRLDFNEDEKCKELVSFNKLACISLCVLSQQCL